MIKEKSGFEHFRGRADREINVDGQAYLFFGGTDYLGLNANIDFMNLFIEGLKIFGINNGTSRNNNVQLSVYADAEDCAAVRYGAEAALITSSGFLAAQLLVKHFSSFGKLVHAPKTHPALWRDDQPIVKEVFNDWANKVVKLINKSAEDRFVIISNTLDNLIPEVYDFTFLKEIDRSKQIILILDDSHGIGVLGNGGEGLYPKDLGENIRISRVASMAKGLGVGAGVILSDFKTIRELRMSSIFTSASPPPPAAMYAFLKAEKIYQEQYAILQRNIEFFKDKLTAELYSVENFPVFYSKDIGLFDRLKENNILISSFPYPSPEDLPLNRIVVTSAHRLGDILKVTSIMNDF